MHMKKNIPFTMLLRAIRYCSTIQAYLNERGKLRMALLLNKYPAKSIHDQYNRMLRKFEIDQILIISNYNTFQQKIINSPVEVNQPIDHRTTLFVHFTYCTSMKLFPKKFHDLWHKCFHQSPINDIFPVLGARNAKNLQRDLVHTR